MKATSKQIKVLIVSAIIYIAIMWAMIKIYGFSEWL